MFGLLSTLDASVRNAVLTVIEGRGFGNRRLLSSGAILWERDGGGFFASNLAEIRDVGMGGIL